jgi:hypothetical protein
VGTGLLGGGKGEEGDQTLRRDNLRPEVTVFRTAGVGDICSVFTGNPSYRDSAALGGFYTCQLKLLPLVFN